MTRSRYDYGSEGTATQNFIPDTDNVYDLGSSSYEFKDLYIDGTANIDSLVADTADINGGTIDGVTIGTNSACTQLVVDNVGINGNTISTSSGSLIILPVAGSITVIGDAGSTSHSLAANDDLLVTGKLEVDDLAYFDSQVTMAGTVYANGNFWCDNIIDSGGSGSYVRVSYSLTEEITISSGTASGVSSTNLCPADSIIEFVAVRVTAADGGSTASVFDVGRTNGGNLDEFIDGADITTLGTTANSIADNDGVLAAEDMWNAADDTITVTLDGNADTSVKVRIVVWSKKVVAPTS